MEEQQPSKKRRRRQKKRNKVPAELAILNAPTSERLRLLRENDDDALTLFGEELLVHIKRLNTVQQRLEAIDPGDEQLSNSDAQLPLIHDLGHELVSLQETIWAQHTQLRDITEPKSPATVLMYLRLSWVNFCRCSVMMAQAEDMLRGQRGFEVWPSALGQVADSFRFVVTMTRYHRPLSLSDTAIGAYSIRTLMTAMELLCEALDAYGWTPSAGEYIHALFLRYALAVHLPADYAANNLDYGKWTASSSSRDNEDDAEEDATREDVNEDDDDEELLDLNQASADPLMAPALLLPAFINVGERLFFHHLWRTHALTEFWSAIPHLRFNVKRHHALATWRLQHGLPAWKGIMESMLTNKEMLKDTVIGALQNHYPMRVLWPGEPEQMKFEYPREYDGTVDAFNILFRLRIDSFKRMQKTLHFDDPLQYINGYAEQEKLLAHYVLKRADSSEKQHTEADYLETDMLRNRLGVEHERVLLLLFEIVFDTRLKSMTRGQVHSVFAHHSYVDDRSLQGARARPPFDPRQLARTRLEAGWPGFASIWLNYAVVPTLAPGGDSAPRVFITPHLIDALSAWFTFARHLEPHAGGLLNDTLFSKHFWRRFEMPLDLLF